MALVFDLPIRTIAFGLATVGDGVSGASALADAGRVVSVLGAGQVQEANLADGVASGILTIAKIGTTARTVSAQDANGTLAYLADLTNYQPLNANLTQIAQAQAPGQSGSVMISIADSSSLAAGIPLPGQFNPTRANRYPFALFRI